jgi:hypothetical protein
VESLYQLTQRWILQDEEEGAGGRGDRRRRDFEERMAREAEAEDRIMRAKRDARPPAREPPRKKSKGAGGAGAALLLTGAAGGFICMKVLY